VRSSRHCEERSDEAIQDGGAVLDCFASLAMTNPNLRASQERKAMTSTKQRIATVAPPTLQKQLEVLAAARALLGEEDEAARWRRAEIGALRRECGELILLAQELWRQYDPRLRSHVIRYNPDQPRVPGGSSHGGQWTSVGSGSAIDTGGAPAATAPSGSQRGQQYAQADLGTRTDATDGGNVSAAAAQQYPDFVHDVGNAIKEVFDRIFEIDRNFTRIWSSAIPADSPKRPEQFVDSSGQPVLDDQGKQILRPADLPPDAYVQAGRAAKSRNLADAMHELAELARGHPNITAVEDESSKIARLSAMVAYELSPFVHGGSFDAERFNDYYVCDYRHYTSIALGIFMAAAGVSKEDMLTIANNYARDFSTFHEETDMRYTSSAKQDIEDNLRGYELYQSGRIRLKN
jgi:hypothetical protein